MQCIDKHAAETGGLRSNEEAAAAAKEEEEEGEGRQTAL